MGTGGLRERKKAETRRLISDTATMLFALRGFDNVSVAEVAAAANVSTKTVFNYFPRKEDLFLDRFPEMTALVRQAAAERPEGQPVLRTLREFYLGLLAQRHPMSGYTEAGYLAFYRTVADSPALQARVREFVEELEDLVAELFAEAEGEDPAGVRARFAGMSVVATYRTVYLTAARRLIAGEDGETVVADLAGYYRRLFDAVERALDGL